MKINKSNLQFTVEMNLESNVHNLPDETIDCGLQESIISFNYRLTSTLATFLVNHVYKSKRTKKNSAIIENTTNLKEGIISRSFHFNKNITNEFGSCQGDLFFDGRHDIFNNIILHTIELLLLERYHSNLQYSIDRCIKFPCNIYLKDDQLKIVAQTPQIPLLANAMAEVINEIYLKCSKSFIKIITTHNETFPIKPFQPIPSKYSKINFNKPEQVRFYIYCDFGKDGGRQFKVQKIDSSQKFLLTNISNNQKEWLTRKAKYNDKPKLLVHKLDKTNRGVKMNSIEYKLIDISSKKYKKWLREKLTSIPA